jgi:hypothetical protein
LFQEKFVDGDNLNGLVNGNGTYEEEISRKAGIHGATSPNCAANVDR